MHGVNVLNEKLKELILDGKKFRLLYFDGKKSFLLFTTILT